MKKGLVLSKVDGFTLVELLIVMGVLAVVVVTILVSLNPAEAGKKARDTKRMKDLATLEAIVLQWTQDGKAPFCTNDWCRSYSAGQVSSQACNSPDLWIRDTGDGGTPINLCDYAKTIPTDPRNHEDTTIVCGGTASNPQMCLISSFSLTHPGLHYALRMRGSDYHIVGVQESKSNAGNVLNDGGVDTYSSRNLTVEKGSDLTIQ